MAPKRKAAAEAPRPASRPAKRAKKLINTAPTARINVYTFGEGGGGELGLGTAKNAIDVKRPRLNPYLTADKVGVVKVVAGGMHAMALTHDNKIMSWGVNDNGALGRDTTWEGGLKDMDANDDDSDDDDEDDNGLNPKESIPAEVDWSETKLPEGTIIADIAAGDSCSYAITTDGKVYGWGTYRNNEGILGFTPTQKIVTRPILISDLKNITSIVCGANHTVALDTAGAAYAWGAGQQNQLGRRTIERTKGVTLRPSRLGLPKGPKNGIKSIHAGADHSFAISKDGTIYAWGNNSMGETGIFSDAGESHATIITPTVVESLKGKNIINLDGGAHHSAATTAEGDVLVWGQMDGGQMGIAEEELAKLPESHVIRDDRGKARILKVPTKVTAIKGPVALAACSSDHSIAVTRTGKAWSWGFSANYQTGLGTDEDVFVATMIDNTAIREKKIDWATCGGQYSIISARAADGDIPMVNGY